MGITSVGMQRGVNHENLRGLAFAILIRDQLFFWHGNKRQMSVYIYAMNSFEYELLTDTFGRNKLKLV